ncbi:MAG: box helicase [Frankiales bacterium]|nr:box helicase [Frankiales bacterium]
MPPASCHRALSISPDSSHIRDMARSPDKKTPQTASDDRAAPKRRSPLTDFMDASEPLHRGGFAEMPQPELSGTPLTGSIADWAEQIEQEAEKEGRLAGKGDGGKSPKAGKKIPERSASPGRSSRGTSMGGAASARERTAAGPGISRPLHDADPAGERSCFGHASAAAGTRHRKHGDDRAGADAAPLRRTMETEQPALSARHRHHPCHSGRHCLPAAHHAHQDDGGVRCMSR